MSANKFRDYWLIVNSPTLSLVGSVLNNMRVWSEENTEPIQNSKEKNKWNLIRFDNLLIRTQRIIATEIHIIQYSIN